MIKEVLMYLCMFHNMDGELRGWRFPSDEHEPAIHCQACRIESVRRMKRGKPGFFTLLEIAEFERGTPNQQLALKSRIPATVVLDALIRVCGEDMGKKKFEQLVDLLASGETAQSEQDELEGYPDWEELEPAEEERASAGVNFLYSLTRDD